MKRLVAVLSGLLVLPAFGEVMPVFFDDEIEYVDGDVAGDFTSDDIVESTDSTQKVNAPVAAPVNVSARSGNTTRATSRAVASGNSATSVRNNNTVSPRNVATRAGTVSRAAITTTNNVSSRNNVAGRTVTSRAAVTSNVNSTANTTPSRAATSARAGTSATTGVASARRATTNTSATTARAGTTPLVQTDTVNTPLYTGRVGVRGSGTTVSTRTPTTRAASALETTTTTTVTDTTSLDELAQLTDFCKAQYMQCMDTFCDTLDDNQGRCSCSSNLKNYEKIEAALKQATTDLQTVAQSIQYIGLSADQVTTLFEQTEAEAAMQGKTDSSQLKSDLEKIRGLIVDVKSTSTSSSSSSGISMDLSGLLDFSVDSTGFDLTSFFGGLSSNTTSIANQRGEQLYKTAAARCKTSVLNNCVAQGVDANVITNVYDLEIDKQCMAYERSLTDANDQMRSTVTNAQNMLRRARLLVDEKKNAYDLRGCVTALDECMQDDFVCGDDYENCLDPSGRYIVNGAIVVGSTPGQVGASATADNLYSTWLYNTDNDPWTSSGDLANYVKDTMEQFDRTSASTGMSLFLQNKIGYIDSSNNKAVGMCAGILNQCQDYTFNRATNGKLTYNKENTVVKEFLQRAMMQIKASQDTIISEYAQNCPLEVKTCLTRNSYSTTLSSSSQLMSVAVASCSSLITTCMSVNGDNSYSTPDGMQAWVNKLNLAPECPGTAKNGVAGAVWPNCRCAADYAYIPTTNECVQSVCGKIQVKYKDSNGTEQTNTLGETWPNCTGCPDNTSFDYTTGTCK